MTALSEDIIYVTTLGKFTITKSNCTLSQTNGRTRLVWLLIEYLLANRNFPASVEKLIDMLWSGDEASNDPMNALKNLVYRARDLLKKSLNDYESDFILFSQGSYLWNPDLPCVVDAEELEALSKEADSVTIDHTQKIELYRQAVVYYKGDFLPNSGYADWVTARATHLSTLYIECVRKLCDFYESKQQYHEIIALCETALVYVPFEEAIHKTLTYSYLRTGQSNKALKHYNHISNRFYKELGVDISSNMQELYQRILQSINQVEMDLSIIKQDLNESNATPNAYFCDYDTFKNLYRIQARSLMRTGQSVIIILLSLLNSEGSILRGPSSTPAIKLFKKVVITSLRKGDVVASYSPTQFILMLPLINSENAEMVMHRIIRRFETVHKKQDIKIIYNVKPVDSVEI